MLFLVWLFKMFSTNTLRFEQARVRKKTSVFTLLWASVCRMTFFNNVFVTVDTIFLFDMINVSLVQRNKNCPANYLGNYFCLHFCGLDRIVIKIYTVLKASICGPR